ncbi:E3 ubiquitin-protein ligase TRIM39-like [Acipenser oxyrinchus oxyrinchus]|uniref:E3 ubiquitin-protein ligase TRIM39-like n=1 Tax=Acipenser oxyrinchus oxyrinchus TaxID=40147 RepID=A0AAD8CTK8_ACIOX|nr:E3 ubiquitin-protein ligase TRIM39-like [Acipenser oxyrinchus oxyrinchus]
MKQKAVELLDRLAELVANYKAHVIETIEVEQRPVVESLQQSIRRVTEQQSLLKHTQLQADSVWAERDEFLKLFQEELTCPICLQVFSDPVVLPCGHNFCASCIGEVIEREAEKGQHTCPECRSEHKGKAALQRNFKLCNIVEGFKASECTEVLCDMCIENALPAVKTCLKCEISLCALHLKRHGEKKTFQSHSLVDPTADLSARKCSLHDKPLEYYCVEDRSCICVSCCIEGNHKNHDVKSFKTAHAELRLVLESQVKEITAKLNLSESLLQKGKEDETAVKAENAEMKQKAVELLDRLAELVANYKAHVIETIEAEQRPVVESLQQSIRRVAEQQSLLKHTLLQTDSVWAERDEFLFIQKLLAIDSKLTEAIKEPLTEPTAKCLNQIKICGSLEKKTTEIQAEMARIQRDLQALINPSQPLTFDPNTVHLNLILSDDLKTACYTTVVQPYPCHAERFKGSYCQVRCSQGFSSGEHRWEVEMGKSQWGVGVCYKSINGTSVPALGYNEASWSLEWYSNMLKAYTMSRSTPLQCITQPVRVEVHLNYDAGTLSFYNASDSRVHLHTFNTTFTEPVYPAVWIISKIPTDWITLKSTLYTE